MRPVFANSAWVSARESLVARGGRNISVRLRVRYGLVIHPTAGPVLIDTGYTSRSLEGDARGAALRFYGSMLRPTLNRDEQPKPFLAGFGLTAADIRVVIVTHFHADHISGLDLFPNARFIADDAAWTGLKRRSRWNHLHGIFPELLPADFERRLDGLSSKRQVAPRSGLPGGADLFGDGSLIAIDLPGHAEGHFGVLFQNGARPLLYAVDAQWVLDALAEDREPGFPASLIADDKAAMAATCGMLRRYMAAGGDLLLCHDPEPTPYDLPAGRP